MFRRSSRTPRLCTLRAHPRPTVCGARLNQHATGPPQPSRRPSRSSSACSCARRVRRTRRRGRDGQVGRLRSAPIRRSARAPPLAIAGMGGRGPRASSASRLSRSKVASSTLAQTKLLRRRRRTQYSRTGRCRLPARRRSPIRCPVPWLPRRRNLRPAQSPRRLLVNSLHATLLSSPHRRTTLLRDCLSRARPPLSPARPLPLAHRTAPSLRAPPAASPA